MEAKEIKEVIARQLAVYKYGGTEVEVYPHWIKAALLEVDQILSCLQEHQWRNVDPEKLPVLTLAGKSALNKDFVRGYETGTDTQRAFMLKRLQIEEVKDGS